MSILSDQTRRLFRSPLRKKLQDKPSNYFEWLFARSTLVGFVFLATCVFALLLALREFPREGWGYLVYWLHDNVYLVIRGYTFVWNFPVSLIWWGVFLTLTIPRIVGFVFRTNAWTASFSRRSPAIPRIVGFVLQVSLVRIPYICVARRIIRSPWRKGLVKWSNAIRQFGVARWLHIQPYLLLEFVWRERAHALNRLTVEHSPKDADEVQKLTLLWADLYKPPHPNTIDRLTVAFCCLEVLTQIQIHLANSFDNKMVAELVEKIKTTVSQVGTKESSEAKWGLSDIIGDLLSLGEMTKSEQTPEGIHQIVESIECRRLWLVKASRELIPPPHAERGGIARPKSNLESLANDLGDTDCFPLIGSLTMWIALCFATQVSAPRLALAYLEAVEALDFAFKSSSYEPPKKVAALIRDIPRPEQYRVCEILSSRFRNARQLKWNEAFSQNQITETRAIRDSALTMYDGEIAVLSQAAGPTPNMQ